MCARCIDISKSREGFEHMSPGSLVNASNMRVAPLHWCRRCWGFTCWPLGCRLRGTVVRTAALHGCIGPVAGCARSPVACRLSCRKRRARGCALLTCIQSSMFACSACWSAALAACPSGGMGCAACRSWVSLQAVWCWVSLWLVHDSTDLSLLVWQPDGGASKSIQHPQYLSSRSCSACLSC